MKTVHDLSTQEGRNNYVDAMSGKKTTIETLRPKAEFIEWENIRKDAKLPQEDNNEGYIYGIAYLDDEGVDTLDCEWFKTNKERYDAGKDFNVINYNG